MPMLITNSASPPRTTSPVWLITVSAAISGGATQAETMSADSAPMTPTPTYVPPCCSLLLLDSRVLDEARHLDGEQAEHRGRQHHEQHAENSHDPGLIERGLQVEALADGARRNARRGVRERHAEHVGHRQHERAARGNILAAAGDDAREDGHHRQHAGRERQQQSRAEERGEHQEDVAVLDLLGVAVLLGDESAGGSSRRWRWPRRSAHPRARSSSVLVIGG